LLRRVHAEAVCRCKLFGQQGADHGGTIQSIMNRVPMVAAGLHEDKNEVCARIGYFGIGVNLQTKTPTANDIFNAVNEVLTTVIYKVNVSNLADDFDKHNSLQEIAEQVSTLLEGRQQMGSLINNNSIKDPERQN
jgi:UDP:flavonoid glycosyltransferase YjiC (YdhE family)